MRTSFVRALLILSLLGMFGIAAAQSTGGGSLINPLGCGTIPLCVGKVIDFLFIISIPIVTIMVLVGGFQMMTAGGNPEKFSSGKKTILYAAVGFVVVLLADQVPKILQNLFA